jgi:hypothetical protein
VEEDCRTYKLIQIDGGVDAGVRVGKLTASQNEADCGKGTRSKIVVKCKIRKDEEVHNRARQKYFEAKA